MLSAGPAVQGRLFFYTFERSPAIIHQIALFIMRALFIVKMVVCLIVLFAANSPVSAQVRYGFRAGFNLANVAAKPDPDPNTKMQPTFQAGMIFDIPAGKHVTVQPGLMLVGKGFRYTFDFFGESITATSNPMYLQIPISLMYQNSQVYLGAGPYVGLGVFGKTKAKSGGQTSSENIAFGNGGGDNYGPFDLGLNIEAGVKLSGTMRAGIGYGLGLANALPEPYRSSESAVRHRVLSFNLTYLPARKKKQ